MGNALKGDIDKSQRIADDIHRLSVELMREDIIPCFGIYGEDKSCLQREEEECDKRNAKKGFSDIHDGYHQYRPSEMCDACAAYWHTSCAFARALLAVKRMRIIDAERSK